MEEKKELKLTEQQKQKTEDLDASQILKTDILSPLEEDASYICTVRQLAYYIGGRPSAKRDIVFAQKNPPPKDESFFWYKRALSAIRKSLLHNNDTAYIHEGIAELKKLVYKSKQTFKIRDRDLSILALQNYLNISLPLNYRELRKTAISFNNIPYKLWGINIKITPDYVFKANYGGKNIVGAVRVNINKTTPFSLIRMKVVSYLLHKFLEKHVATKDEIVLPEFCLCIDAFGRNWSSAPSRTEAPNIVLKDTCTEYTKQWDSTEKVDRSAKQ